MKIDCSQVLNYIKEYNRMCEYYSTYSSCDNCPLIENPDCYIVPEITQESIDIVQKWSDENPLEEGADNG
jgi:hypothetical protein